MALLPWYPNRTQTFRRVLKPNQSIVSIDRPCIKLENSPPAIRPPPLATTTTKLPAYKPCTTYSPSPTMQLSQSTAGERHNVACAHAPEPYGSAKSMNSAFESVRFPATSYTPIASPTYTASRPTLFSNPPSLQPGSCIPLPPVSRYDTSINPLLERGRTSPNRYDIRSPPSFATSRHHLVDDHRWRDERASDLNLRPLTICTALVSKPIIVFP